MLQLNQDTLPHMDRRLFYLLWLLVFPSAAQAYLVSGTVSNDLGEPVPYVRVYEEGGKAGAFTDDTGHYQFDLPAGSWRIVFQHLSYSLQIHPLDVRENKVLDVRLDPTDLQLKAVEITSGKKDPAYDIIRQVIDSKKDHLYEFDSYQCETYLKVILEEDTLPGRNDLSIWEDSLFAESVDTGRVTLNFIESQSTTYFQAPGKYKSLVHAYRDFAKGGEQALLDEADGVDGSGGDYESERNNPYLFYLNVSDADFNFFQNLVYAPDLSDRPLISPLHATLWQLTYRYKLEERIYDGGRVQYRILIKPRNREGPHVKGEILVEDGTWDLLKIDLEVMPSTLIWFRNFRLMHRYEHLPDGRRVLTEEQYTYSIKDGKSRLYGQAAALHSAHQPDVAFAKNFFNNELRRTDKEAFEKDSSYWASIRPISLLESEEKFIHVQDSINAHLRSPEYLRKSDSIFNHISLLDFLLNGIAFRDRVHKLDYYVNSVLEQVQPLGVGGYRHNLGGSVRKTFRRGTALRLSGDLDYGFNNSDIKGNGRLGFTYQPRKFGSAFIRFGDIYRVINNQETFTNILSRNNFTQKTYYGAGHYMEVFNGFRLATAFEYASYRSIDSLRLAGWTSDLFGENNIPQTFDPYRQLLLQVKISYTPGQKYHMEPFRKVIIGSKWPTFFLEYEKAVPGILQSEMNFDFLEVGLRHEFRPGPFGISRWTVRAGKYLQASKIQFTDYKFFRGSDPYLFANPLKAFQLLGPTISTTNEYMEGHYLHDFGGTLIDKIPLLRLTPLQVTAGAGSLFIRDGGFFHSEVYAGLQLPFRIRKQRFKIGGYFATSYSNHTDAISAQFKYGITFFNPIKNQWEY